MTPTQRTLALLKERGYVVGKVERWIERSKQRIDLFGFIDYIALDVEQQRIIGVQSCGQDHAKHLKKIQDEPRARQWLDCGGEILLISWRQLVVKRGMKRKKWEPRIESITGGHEMHSALPIIRG